MAAAQVPPVRAPGFAAAATAAPPRRVRARAAAPAAARVERISIDEGAAGLRQVHADPDVYLIDDFLTPAECDSLVAAARAKGLERSPVAYAGWTADAKELLSLAAGGPAAWYAFPALNSGLSAMGAGDVSAVDVFGAVLGAWASGMAVSCVGVGAWLAWRRRGLSELRTSESTTLYGGAEGGGDDALVERAEALLRASSDRFEAPTVIRYAQNARLAPHFDANRAAGDEDAARGGQTLATLLCYLNDVPPGAGGRTRFGRIGVDVDPQKGQALLFFPAGADGQFDERTEHGRAQRERCVRSPRVRARPRAHARRALTPRAHVAARALQRASSSTVARGQKSGSGAYGTTPKECRTRTACPTGDMLRASAARRGAVTARAVGVRSMRD